MKYYKVIENEELKMIGTGSVVPDAGEEIEKTEYDQLMEQIKADAEAHRQAVENYAEQVKAGTITIDQVPEEYREEVSYIVNPPQPVDPEQALIDEIVQEVAGNE